MGATGAGGLSIPPVEGHVRGGLAGVQGAEAPTRLKISKILSENPLKWQIASNFAKILPKFGQK